MVDAAKNEACRDIGGADALLEWFGYWPTFHDAEVLSIELNRQGISRIRIHTWEMTSEVDAKGFYVLRKHVTVTFLLESLDRVELSGFNHQNVLMYLSVARKDGVLWPGLDGIYGVTGEISAGSIRIELEPGAPNE